MAKDITLFDHNEKAYEALISSLEKSPLAFIEHATGTGKSFIMLKYLYTKMREKRILFITRHYEMLEQLFNDQMTSLGISQDDFYKFDSAIYPNILDLNMEEIIRDYDCIVWDEAHHCGAPKWSVKVNELKELVKSTPGKVMIGATATRIRYLDDYMDVAEKFFDGNVVSVLPVTRAILKNLLPAPLIIMTGQSCIEYIDKLQKKLKRLPQVPAVKEYQTIVENYKEQMLEEFYVGNVLKRYGIKDGEKYIVFCSDIKDIERKMIEAEHWFKDIGPVKMYSAHSAQKRTTNISQIKEFSEERSEISLMFAVDIFNEGFHIDGVDGILIFRKTKSPIIYWQQLGRALSFSVRRKQIKIYDFANNTSENKVVYELYKEMLDEAKRLIIEDPENKELYLEILQRFKIVDQTTSILEKLNEIESKIDQEFFIKSRIDLAIYKLEEYRSFYPNTNFYEELLNNRLAPDYVSTYNYICEVEDYLTLEQVEHLQKLNITFTAKIDLPVKKRLEVLGDNKTFKELEDRKIEDTFTSYVDFCNKHGRRPTIEDDRVLYLAYRGYLRDLSRSKLNRLLARIPFRLTLEETVILGNYPSRDDINEYINIMKSKIEKNINLDAIEIKVLKRISHTISEKDAKLLNYLMGYIDVSYQIDEAIDIIRTYKKNVDIFNTKSYKQALRTISRYALRINNKQFAELLELGIKLPSKINMTMERRLKELKGFESFYEKKQSETNNALNSYLIFLNEYKRRPDITNERENKLQQEYESQLYKTSSKKAKEIANILIELQLPLTLEEAVLSNNHIDVSSLEDYILMIRSKLINNELVTSEELKILRTIERRGYPLKIDISNFIKMIININTINQMLRNYESNTLNDFQRDNLLRSIFIRGRFLTKHHIEWLKRLKINIPQEIIDNLSNNPDCINFFEHELKSQEKFWIEFIDYLETNGKYPDDGSSLMQTYHYYLSYATIDNIKRKLRLISNLGIKLGIEERILLHDITREEGIDYLESIKEKLKNKEVLDPFESRVCRAVDKIAPTDDYQKKIKPATINVQDDLENKIVRNIRTCIRLNPETPIDLQHNYSLSRNNRRRLEIYRVNELGKKTFRDILKRMKHEHKPISSSIDENLLDTYNSIAISADLNPDNEYLLNQIKSLNREYILQERGFAIADFVSKYIDFIQQSGGKRPNLSSEDEYERNLAAAYDDIHDLLELKEIQKIERALKKSVEEEDLETFYSKLIDFINKFGRFPCGNSDNPYEVHLNNLFQNFGSNLTKPQNDEIKKLRKTYGRATIMATMEFSKKNDHKL